MRGRLYAIRALHLSYPALILDVDLQARVHGNCYEIRDSFTDADLRYLDTYEEYFPDAPSKSEYLRKALEINLTELPSLRS